MAAPTPSTSSPLSATTTPASSSSLGTLSTSLLGSSGLGVLSTSALGQSLLSNELLTALGSPAATSSPTGTATGSQSTGETIVGWIAAAVLIIAGFFMMGFSSPKTVRVLTSAPPDAPAPAATATTAAAEVAA